MRLKKLSNAPFEMNQICTHINIINTGLLATSVSYHDNRIRARSGGSGRLRDELSLWTPSQEGRQGGGEWGGIGGPH